MRFVVFILLGLILLIGLDMTFARMADKDIRQTNAGLDEKLLDAELDLEGDRKQACVINHVYWLYVYQTCFVRGDNFFQFVYHKPMPLVLGYGRSEDSLYFQESAIGERLATIREGVVVQERIRVQEH